MFLALQSNRKKSAYINIVVIIDVYISADMYLRSGAKFYDLTNERRGSNEYIAGLRPDAG